MLTGAAFGGLEVRADDDGSVRITGRFPYDVSADLAPGRSETFAAGSLEAESNVYLLSQHRWDTPLASSQAGTLSLSPDTDGLAFEARLSRDIVETSHGRDAVALIRSGLAVGLSPGFRVKPGGERVESRGAGIMRTVTRAELHELSIVTRPAFPQAQVEARAWRPWRPITQPAAWRWR